MRRFNKLFRFCKRYIRQKKINRYCSNLRKKYCHNDLTIISNSCIGGVVYHQLGLKFNSPTINMWIEMKGFLTFCRNVEPYFQCEVEEINLGCTHPTGIVKPHNLEPIIIHFNHYRSFDEAKHKWEERKKRIIKNKIIIFFDASAMVPINDSFIKKWNMINYPKIAFGCLKRDDIPDYYYINFYDDIRPGRIFEYCKHGKIFLNQVNFVELLNKYLDQH